MEEDHLNKKQEVEGMNLRGDLLMIVGGPKYGKKEYKKRFPIHYYTIAKDLERLKQIVDSHVDYINERDWHGNTPLTLACHFGYFRSFFRKNFVIEKI